MTDEQEKREMPNWFIALLILLGALAAIVSGWFVHGWWKKRQAQKAQVRG